MKIKLTLHLSIKLNYINITPIHGIVTMHSPDESGHIFHCFNLREHCVGDLFELLT